MKTAKKWLAGMLALVIAALSVAGCSAPAQKTTIKVAGLNGPTGIGMVKLMADAKENKTANNYEISLVGAPEEIQGKIISGELDIAAVPTNMASILYNKTGGKVQILALNTLGVLSIVTKGEEISSVADLKGKKIYATGQGSTPEYVLNYILKQNGLDPEKDVKIEYLSEHAELATMVLSGEAPIALLPQPFVTQVTTKDAEVKIALDLTEEWDQAVDGKSVLTMGCLVGRTEFIEQNKSAVDAFLQEYKASAEYTATNTADAAALVEQFGVMPSAAMAEKAIPHCHITYLDGAEMKAKLGDFLKVLFEANPKSVGGTLPDENFYYQK